MFANVFAAQTAPTTQHLKESWEDEIGTTISENTWCKCLYNIHTCSINARHQLIQYKVVHRPHYSRVKLHSFFPSTPPICVKCKQTDGTLAHILSFCSKLGSGVGYSIFILRFMDRISPPDPETGVLGWSHQLMALNHWKAQAVQFGMVIAKRSILKFWNKDIDPTFEIWLTELLHTLHI